MTNNKIAKSATFYTISSFMLRGLSIITAPIFTRLLTTSDYGLVSTFTAWVGLISVFTGLGLGTSIVRGYTKYKEDFYKFLSSIQFLGMISAIVVFCIAILNLELLSSFMMIDKYLVIYLFIYLIFFQSVNFIQTQYRFEYKYKAIITISVINSLTSIGLSFIFIFLFSENKYIGRTLGLYLPLLIMGIIFALKIFLQGKTFFNKQYWSFALKLSLPLIPHGLAMIALAQIDRLMITNIVGIAENGIYSFGYTYALLIIILTTSLNQAIQPKIYRDLEDNKINGIRKLIHDSNIIITIAIILFVGIAPEALMILGPSTYFDARWIVIPVILGSFFQFMYQNFACVEIHQLKTKIMALGSILAAILNIGLNFIFIPKYGYITAAYTTLFSYFCLMIYHYFSAKIIIKTSIYSLKNISILSIALGGVVFLLQLLFDFTLYRYIILSLILVIFIFLNRKTIKLVANSILKGDE